MRSNLLKVANVEVIPRNLVWGRDSAKFFDGRIGRALRIAGVPKCRWTQTRTAQNEAKISECGGSRRGTHMTPSPSRHLLPLLSQDAWRHWACGPGPMAMRYILIKQFTLYFLWQKKIKTLLVIHDHFSEPSAKYEWHYYCLLHNFFI